MITPLRLLWRSHKRSLLLPPPPSLVGLSSWPAWPAAASAANPKMSSFSSGAHLLPPNPRFPSQNPLLALKIAPFVTNTQVKGRRSLYTSHKSILLRARSALVDYLHCTGGLDFIDAEHIATYCPTFLSNLLTKVKHHHPSDDDVASAITRFLRYHPINEFEPFFESIGVKPHHLNALLPDQSTFLREDPAMMENYRTLCTYGFPRNRIGKMYIEGTHMFRYAPKILACKLQAYEDLGLTKYNVTTIVSACPRLLVGDVHHDFVALLKELGSVGLDPGWLAKNVRIKKTYYWGRMLLTLSFLHNMGFSEQEIGTLVRKHPGFLLDGSGKALFQLVGMFFKLGAPRNEVIQLLTHFPRVKVTTFFKNMQVALCFLIDNAMDFEDIKTVMRSHPQKVGVSTLLSAKSVRVYLGVAKKKVCKIIKEDPNNLFDYVRGAKIERLFDMSREDDASLIRKKKLLISLGLVKHEGEMLRALGFYRGEANGLLRRYNYLVEKGFQHDEIVQMAKEAPKSLWQRFEGFKCKIDFILDELGYPIKFITMQPSSLRFCFERIKLRLSMYVWLRSEGVLNCELLLGTILDSSDKNFINKRVRQHPEGLEVWNKLKKAVYEC